MGIFILPSRYKIKVGEAKTWEEIMRSKYMVLEEEWKLNSMDDRVSHIPLIPWVPNRQEMSLLLPRCFPGASLQ